MVISTTINGTTIYLHAAYATDEHGSDFNLTEFPGAVYVGNYSDQSATESNDWRSYTWKLIGDEVVNSDDIEAYEDLEPSEITDVEDSIDEINETTDDVETRTLNNNDNLQLTQNDVNQGIGNLNLLSGTNQGAQNWTSGSSTLSDYSTAIYNDDDVVNAMHAVIVSGSDTLEFDANSLNDFISNNAEINTFTLSYDMNVSNASGTFTVESSGVLNFDAPDFTTDDPLEDFAGAWVHFISTTELTSGTPTETVLKFIYSGSANDTIDIANLKIEAGADATPWRASLAEVESTANTALSTANTAASDAATALAAAQAVNNYFWHDSSGAHVTQVTQTQYQADPPNAGGNTLITSTGLNVLDGTTTLASFGSTGVQIGQSAESHSISDAQSFSIYDDQDRKFFEAKNLIGTDGNVVYEYTGDGIRTDFEVYEPTPIIVSAKVNGTAAAYTVNDETVVFSTAPANNALVEIIVTPRAQNSALYKSYDVGIRAERTSESWSNVIGAGYRVARGFMSYTEGLGTVADGRYSHAEGTGRDVYDYNDGGDLVTVSRTPTRASGDVSHAEGEAALASGNYSHAQNWATIAAGESQTAIGRANIADTNEEFALIVGNGSYEYNDPEDPSRPTGYARSNAFTVDWSGNVVAAGTVTVSRDPTSNLEVATKQYVDNSGGGGFDGTATIIKTSATLSNTATNYTLSDNISNYKFLTFSFSNSTNYGRWTVPVSVFKLSTTAVENVVTRGGSTTRYAYVKYVNDTKINVYCSVNNGLNMIVYGIK